MICLYFGTFYLPQVWCCSSAFIGFPSSTYGFSFLYSIRFSTYHLPPAIIYFVFSLSPLYIIFYSIPFPTLLHYYIPFSTLLLSLSHFTPFPFLFYYIPFLLYSFLFLSLLVSLTCLPTFPFHSTPSSFSPYSFLISL